MQIYKAIVCCLCTRPQSAPLTLKACAAADYSQIHLLDLVMVHRFCSSARQANKSIPSTHWYSVDALIALSAACFIKGAS